MISEGAARRILLAAMVEERCGEFLDEGVWIKPNACAEIPERTHTHSCDVCVALILTGPNN